MARISTAGDRLRRRDRGFTLLELLVALGLLALLASVLFGSLNLAGNSWDRGEAKVEHNANMRLAEEFVRGQLESQYPLRLHKVVEFPLIFDGESDELRYAAALPARVNGGGIWAYRLIVDRNDARSPLVLQRVVPDVNAMRPPDFGDPERSILAQDIDTVRFGYYGRDAGSNDTTSEPTWRDHWDDPQRLPLLVRIDVKPLRGPAWPTLVVAIRSAPEAGCHAWDAARQRCVGI